MTKKPKQPVDPEIEELTQRNERQRNWFRARQPKAISDVVAQLFAKRGYAARKSNEQLADVWRQVAGEPLAKFSQAIAIRRGQLEVVVANSLMLQEIDFEKTRIVAALSAAIPETNITGLRLRVGTLRD